MANGEETARLLARTEVFSDLDPRELRAATVHEPGRLRNHIH